MTLFNLTAASAGTYKCEVSAEAPSFRTKSGSQDMVVVVIPKKSLIDGAQPKYQVGDLVNVTCYSYRYFITFCKAAFKTNIVSKILKCPRF